MSGERVRIRGQVQGVGFRPAVWRLAQEMGLSGGVRNTGEGVEICLWGDGDGFIRRLQEELPDLARIEGLDRSPISGPRPDGFMIESSESGGIRVGVTPDAVVCADCVAEARDPFERRYRYAFANCTNCGPRFSIVDRSPYDRENTSMSDFPMCTECGSEYEDPADRRFHAQAIACHACGPGVFLERLGGGVVNLESFSMLDAVDAAGGALLKGYIVAVRGIGGVHLACDAENVEAVRCLRDRKGRGSKAFALMARDLEVIRRYARVSEEEVFWLEHVSAPIVLLEALSGSLSEEVAPGLDRLGFMLPYTPLHHLMLRRLDRPVVMTSGNRSGCPQCVGNEEARRCLEGIADFALLHNREIRNRVDDSVLRVDMGRARLFRRARGFAPQALSLPEGFSREAQVLALGAELKNTFCLVRSGEAILSQHMGDLRDAGVHADMRHNLELYRDLFAHDPELIAIDRHPDYLSGRMGKEWGLPLVRVQHHHAHMASCMAENGLSLGSAPVLGIVMDGSGFGDDGEIWGGEFLIGTYGGYRRAGCLKPVALPGGDVAMRQPWRNLYAHLRSEMSWSELEMNFADLPVFKRLESLPRVVLDGMISGGKHAPLSSSCGRLFDAAAALTQLCWDEQGYEGEAAMLFEAALDEEALHESEDLSYPFSIPLLGGDGLPYIEPLAVWRAMLGDLLLGSSVGVISARFHRGLARALLGMALRLTSGTEIETVVLSGGCFQNATLFRLLHEGLEGRGLRVLSHGSVPSNDGGLSLGQAVVALAVSFGKERGYVSGHTG